MDRKTGRKTDRRWTDRQKDRQTGGQMGILADRQTKCLAARQRNDRKDRQIDRGMVG
jgi:hypothetical protein